MIHTIPSKSKCFSKYTTNENVKGNIKIACLQRQILFEQMDLSIIRYFRIKCTVSYSTNLLLFEKAKR